LVAGERIRRSRIADAAVYLAVRLLICVVQMLRIETCQKLARWLAWLASDVLRIRRDLVTENLRSALPEYSEQQRDIIARRMWEHLFLMTCEVALAARKIHETNWRDYVAIEGKRELVEIMLRPRSVVAVTAHLGNFEMCGFISGLLGFPTFTLARPIDNPYLHEFLVRFRQSTGQYLVPTKGSAELVQRVIRRGDTVALLGDHYGGPKGCWIDFLNRPASFHKSIALFALANRVPMIVVYATRSGPPMHFTLQLAGHVDPDDTERWPRTVPEMTAWFSQFFEKAIREHPAQYWWLHRRWKDTRHLKRSRRTAIGRAEAQPVETPT
jgi:KDO2-lipid IV(A) lauroyltransferase